MYNFGLISFGQEPMPATALSRALPSGPAAAPALNIDASTLQWLTGAVAACDEVFAIEQGGSVPAVFVLAPSLAHDILVRRHGSCRKGRGFERVKMLLGNGLIVSDGDHWRRSRTMVQPAFKPKAIEQMLERMHRHAARVADEWAARTARGEALDLAEETCRYSLAVVLDCIFGDDIDPVAAAEPDSPFAFLRPEAARDLGMVQSARALRSLIQGFIEQRRASGESRDDFLGLYLDARDKSDQPFSDRELLDEMITLIVAGFETTANTLTWVWFELARQPEVAARVRAEVLAQGAHLATDADTLAGLVYTQQVLQETLRLYPPVWLYTRCTQEAFSLGEYDIPAGAQVYLSPYLTQRSTRYWDEPETFRPERFSGVGQRARDAAFFPFSLGPRRCIGEHFSYLEMKVLLATVLPGFTPSVTPHEVPAIEYAINLRADDPLALRLTAVDAA